jgi:hypothetical protein
LCGKNDKQSYDINRNYLTPRDFTDLSNLIFVLIIPITKYFPLMKTQKFTLDTSNQYFATSNVNISPTYKYNVMMQSLKFIFRTLECIHVDLFGIFNFDP